MIFQNNDTFSASEAPQGGLRSHWTLIERGPLNGNITEGKLGVPPQNVRPQQTDLLFCIGLFESTTLRYPGYPPDGILADDLIRSERANCIPVASSADLLCVGTKFC